MTMEVLIELQLRKLGNSTGLTLPPAVLREHRLSAGQSITLATSPEVHLVLIAKPQKPRFIAKVLNTRCKVGSVGRGKN